MSAASFANETINFQLATTTASAQQAASLSSGGSNSSDAGDFSYCALPTIHSHATLQTAGQLWARFNELEDADEARVEQQPLAQDASRGAAGSQPLEASESLDPYIDAVPVRRRVNNRRGARVRPAAHNANQLAVRVASAKADHRPDSSYYSKSVHIEQSGESKGPAAHVEHYEESYAYTDDSDDSDSDDDDYHDGYGDKKHVHKHHAGHQKHKKLYHVKGKRKKRKRPKKIYVKVHKTGGGKHGYKHGHGLKKKRRRRRRRKKKKHYHGHGHGHGYDKKHEYDKHEYDKKHHYGKGAGHEEVVEKKVIYVKYKEPGKYHEHHKDHHHGYSKPAHEKTLHLSLAGHHNHNHNHGHHHHHQHYKGTKMSLAGLLGQTLLCVNYLLVLKQPTYDKYASHAYSKYAPHQAHTELELKHAGGPIILAHCGELPEQRALVRLRKRSLNQVNEQNSTQMSNLNGTFLDRGNITSTLGSDGLIGKSRRLLLETAEQQARAVFETGRPRAAAAPPAFYYSLAPASSLRRQGEYEQTRGGLLTSLMNKLLFFPSSASQLGAGDDDDQALLQISSPPRAGRRRLEQLAPPRALRLQEPLEAAFERAPGDGNLENLAGRPAQRALGLRAGGRVVLVANRPEVVQRRDNLVELRTRPVEIRLRVTSGRRSILGLPQRALRLTLPVNGDEPPASSFASNAPDRDAMRLGLAVRAPEQMQQQQQPQADQLIQNDQPSELAGLSNLTSANQRQLLDLPEFALSGDSIELTCNHRLPLGQLYSVRWFRDSLEFYRFVPSQTPPKSALALPDLELDLERSNAHSLYLRNVSHLTGGQFRCEATAEAPSFELRAGERQLAVYALPDTGPRLTLAANGRENEEEASVLVQNGRLVLGPLAVANRAQQRALLAGGRLNLNNQNLASAFGNNEVDEGDEDQDERDFQGEPFGGGVGRAQALQRRAAGPLVRCASDRSRPVAQLRLLVNGRPIEARRTLENATMSYSDGLESNVISFRVQLTDFLLDEQLARALEQPAGGNALERAASLKSSADQNNATRTSTTTSTTSTTSTSTTTTRRPTVAGQRGAGQRKRPAEKKKNATTNPNAQVQFDDQATPAGGNQKPPENKRRAKQAAKQAQGRNRAQNKWRGEPPPAIGNLLQNDHFGPLDADADAADADADANEEAARLPVARDNSRAAAATATTIALIGLDNGARRAPGANRNAQDLDDNNARTNLPDVGGGGGRVKSEMKASERLVRGEQRAVVTSRLAGDANAGQLEREREPRTTIGGGAPRAYSNFIRVKCVSTVPALGYEMISELSVPLSLLVPASQLSAAIRGGQPATLNAASGALERQEGAPGRAGLDAAERDAPDNSNGNSNGRPGSLQAPRTVLVDRVAQASGQAPSLAQARNSTASELQQRPRRREGETKTPARWMGSSRARFGGAAGLSSNQTGTRGIASSCKQTRPMIDLISIGVLLSTLHSLLAAKGLLCKGLVSL